MSSFSITPRNQVTSSRDGPQHQHELDCKSLLFIGLLRRLTDDTVKCLTTIAALPTARTARMAHTRRRLNWLYDDEHQQFTTPSGTTVTLQEIAQLLQDRLTCHHDFYGPWAGWRMRNDQLIPPGSTARTRPALKPHNLAAFLRWATATADPQIHPSNAPAAQSNPAAYTHCPAPELPHHPRNADSSQDAAALAATLAQLRSAVRTLEQHAGLAQPPVAHSDQLHQAPVAHLPYPERAHARCKPHTRTPRSRRRPRRPRPALSLNPSLPPALVDD